MPVEIKELHIRVAVSGKPPEAHGASGGAAKQAAAAGQAAGKDELVAECVEQVFELLQARKER
ncbi:hypothetical protein KK141_10440 [Dyella sp. LX-66]|jgi:hypothetical protein|uniref:Uncharacterized protein n=1 Tax=Dyella marensis TaxID=500610 RepID=A0A1I1ZGC3_9GAMM|nr:MULTISPECIES: DUF5908 family protein [Dyella]MBT2116972.1 hypothetical protein [Dyella sp. LX-1]MBT2139952.1 hypothetical protein [Dyella sp. LX-66]SFE30769.1 hypothetical protein SAMN02799615_00712 [Dyella marensis]